ncbi:hypothetical protein [Rubinisphaera margarita]|uniref:hypothetical protein n=1 Tax=Rubinisphaera margarita TaxID=2909586 RepID=UPI001EE97DE0|nr:hypothetical protein [Rubinisphaera margarita]
MGSVAAVLFGIWSLGLLSLHGGAIAVTIQHGGHHVTIDPTVSSSMFLLSIPACVAIAITAALLQAAVFYALFGDRDSPK